MASYSNAQHISEPAEDQPSLAKVHDDDVFSSSSQDSNFSIRKPLSSFCTDDDEDLEDGYRKRSAKVKRSWWSLRDIMTIRERGKASLEVEGYEDLNNDRTRLMRDAYALQRTRRERNWYNYCIFGGISGLTILAILLVLNLLLGLATLLWTSDLDLVLQNWGQPGTGTEGLAWYPTDFTRDILPIPCHSHNDYWRKVPLFSALRAGCTGVEADVWLFDDDLYIGHNTASLTRNRTFTSLYVDPLVKILQDQNPTSDFYNGTSHGVFDADPGQSLTLLIDVKTSGAETWPWVLKQVEPLRKRGWLSFMENDTVHVRPITLVGTGNTPFDVLTANSTYRDAFFDAPLDTMWEARRVTPEMQSWPKFDDSLPGERLDEDEGSAGEKLPTSSTETQNLGQGLSGTLPDTQFNTSNSYYASVSFGQAVGKIWRGRLSPRQMKIIRGQIRGAHRRGLKARYWDLPAWPLGLRNHVWDVLVKEGVDYLNVDDLRGVSKQVW